ncbi:class I SAM-dependent methyltransferase [Paenibacillus guangzhouensis]|uniref:class I SAM-dependent methyltransferase n=1 Tax=Paenibacillus guangzhouensis TaxID=1473112 RepID=UPI00126767C0|nr:class I SAM-dependent methyltransferase [Paenibacillus guangzhouensis]
MNKIKDVQEAWNRWSDTDFAKYRSPDRIAKLITEPESAFHKTTYAMIREAFPSLEGKRICVPSSGDNHAVFAFHLMGAIVTSCDISERQLEHASNIAHRHGWDIEFIWDDTMELNKLHNNAYDFVYTSNGVHVWINNLQSMYDHVHRILDRRGIYMMFDIHPFLRPFGIQARKEIHIVHPYHLTGPFGEIPRYKWRIQDLMNAMIRSGLYVRQVEEMYAEDGLFWVDDSQNEGDTMTERELHQLCNWEYNPLAALPQWLTIQAGKL